ncbi:hypothetical protein EVAR_58826_1 [Eumeta japonica]|uniref:Uncharacterized protein n=1 Tax=Eumeta variegata TaxID=151549 RepID=A0A4C1YKV2_EUMVA|nr:hypothetical protein EVAR_58826_1 [Eumeta japonica]
MNIFGSLHVLLLSVYPVTYWTDISMPLVAAGIVWLYDSKISPCESDTPVCLGTRTAHNGIFSLFPSPFVREEPQKKWSVRVQRPTEKPEEEGKQPTAESEACLVQHDGVSLRTVPVEEYPSSTPVESYIFQTRWPGKRCSALSCR